MLVEVKFSIFVTQEFIFLGMIDNICESFVAVLSILYLCTVVNFEALSLPLAFLSSIVFLAFAPFFFMHISIVKS